MVTWLESTRYEFSLFKSIKPFLFYVTPIDKNHAIHIFIDVSYVVVLSRAHTFELLNVCIFNTDDQNNAKS